MIELLTHPALYAITTALIVLGLSKEWKAEQNRKTFRFILTLALVGNAAMLVLTYGVS